MVMNSASRMAYVRSKQVGFPDSSLPGAFCKMHADSNGSTGLDSEPETIALNHPCAQIRADCRYL